MPNIMRRTRLAAPLLAAVVLAVGPAPLMAAGDGGGGSGGGGSGGGGGGGPIRPCPGGQLPDGAGGCRPQARDVLPDEALADYAYVLAKAERYAEALDVLDLMAEPETAEALNYRGYATRKLGGLEEGIVYYRKAVALDPDYALVREYLGEAYVDLGAVELAREQLAEVERICGRDCEAYADLASAIEAGAGDSAW